MNHCFVVCDLKPEFADRMARYVNKRRLSPYLMESFTDVNLLVEYGRNRYIDVLLIDDSLYTEQIKALNIGKVFLLVSDRANLHTEGESKLYKFSAIPELMNEVMCDYADRNKIAMSNTGHSTVKLVGAFSPDTSLGHSSFLLTMALKTAEKKKVIYLNIKSTHGFRKILNKMSGLDLSDVMFEIKNGKRSMDEWSSDAVLDYGKLDYILPALTITDLHYVETEDWKTLLTAVQEAEYDYVFFDVDESTGACFEILEACDLIYSSYEDSFSCQTAFAEFENTMAQMGLSVISKKIIRISPPKCDLDTPCGDYFQSLMSGKMGMYVDKVLAGNR